MIIKQGRRFTDKDPGSGSELNQAIASVRRGFNDHDESRKAWSTISFKVSVVTSGSAYAVTNSEIVTVVNKTVGSATAVTLPSSPLAGRVAIVKDGKGDAGSNNITITAASGNIDGAASKVISSNYGAMQLVYNGTEWNVVSAS